MLCVNSEQKFEESMWNLPWFFLYLPLMFQIQLSAVNLGPRVGTRQSRDPSQSAKGISCERKISLCVLWICLSQQPNWPILTQCWKHHFWPWGSLILKPTNNHCCGLNCATLKFIWWRLNPNSLACDRIKRQGLLNGAE